MTSFSILLGTELKKRWRLNQFLIIGSISLVFCGIAWLLGFKSDSAPNSNLSFNQYLDGFLLFVVPFWVIFTTGGIIRFDIKDHWLRTILSRPVRREIYLGVKFIESMIGLAVGMLLLGLLPMLLFSSAAGAHTDWNLSGLLTVLMDRFLAGSTYIAISIFFSCWLPSYINAVILAGWMFVDAVVVQLVITKLLFTEKILGAVADFFFPSGFGDATAIILNKGAFPFEEYLWGFAALFFFTALSMLLINKVQLDSSAD